MFAYTNAPNTAAAATAAGIQAEARNERLPPRPGEPRHHRTNRHARYVGDLFVGESIKFSENNHGFEFQR